MFTQSLDFKTTDLETFPFPFTSGNYRYSNDLKRLPNINCIEVTPEYRLQVEASGPTLRTATYKVSIFSTHIRDAMGSIRNAYRHGN